MLNENIVNEIVNNYKNLVFVNDFKGDFQVTISITGVRKTDKNIKLFLGSTQNFVIFNIQKSENLTALSADNSLFIKLVSNHNKKLGFIVPIE